MTLERTVKFQSRNVAPALLRRAVPDHGMAGQSKALQFQPDYGTLHPSSFGDYHSTLLVNVNAICRNQPVIGRAFHLNLKAHALARDCAALVLGRGVQPSA